MRYQLRSRSLLTRNIFSTRQLEFSESEHTRSRKTLETGRKLVSTPPSNPRFPGVPGLVRIFSPPGEFVLQEMTSGIAAEILAITFHSTPRYEWGMPTHSPLHKSGAGRLRVVSSVGADSDVRPKGDHRSQVNTPVNPKIPFKPYSFPRRYRQRDTGSPADCRGVALSHFQPVSAYSA